MSGGRKSSVRRLVTIIVLWVYYTRRPGRWISRDSLPEPARRVATWSAIRFDNALKRAYIPILWEQLFRPCAGISYTKWKKIMENNDATERRSTTRRTATNSDTAPLGSGDAAATEKPSGR